MTSRSDILSHGDMLRKILCSLADDTRFTEFQRHVFRSLCERLGGVLERFDNRPRYGGESEFYYNPAYFAEQGQRLAGAVAPEDDAGIANLSDTVEKCIAALDSVTRDEVVVARGLRGALLTPRAASVLAAAAPPAGPGPTPSAKTVVAEPAWISKLLTMFPAEAVTAYTFGSTSLPGNHLIIMLTTLAAMLCVRWVALKPLDSNDPPDWRPLAVAAVSFILWVGATDIEFSVSLCPIWHLVGGKCMPDATNFQKWAVYLILIWTWVVPPLVKLDPAP